MNLDLFHHWNVRPFSFLGLTHTFFIIHVDTLVYTWVAMAVLAVVTLVGRYYVRRKKENVFVILLERFMAFFSELFVESIGFFSYPLFSFITAIFLFTMTCNIIGLLPFVEEPTQDLNTTLAIGVSSFLFVQYQHISKVGFLEYAREFTKPIILLTPLEIIGKLASIISMSFRLFGNIFGGAIVFMIILSAIEPFKEWFVLISWTVLCGYFLLRVCVDLSKHRVIRRVAHIFLGLVFLVAGAQLFFGLFEGIVQAFVLTMLTVTYLAVAIGSEHDEQVAS